MNNLIERIALRELKVQRVQLNIARERYMILVMVERTGTIKRHNNIECGVRHTLSIALSTAQAHAKRTYLTSILLA